MEGNLSVIASNVPNDGSESITVPNTPSQCLDYGAVTERFSMSLITFIINGITNDFTITSPNANQSVCARSTTFPIDLTAGTFADPVSLSVMEEALEHPLPQRKQCYTYHFVTLNVTTTGASSGTNTFTISGNSTTGTKTLDVVLDVLTALHTNLNFTCRGSNGFEPNGVHLVLYSGINL